MMYLIAYEVKRRSLGATNEVREKIEDQIVEFGSWWRYFGDFWIVDTEMDVNEMNDMLLKYMDERDNLLIIGVQAPYEGWLPEGAWDWLLKAEKSRKLTASH